MLFSSPEFIYLFLPTVLLGFFWLARWTGMCNCRVTHRGPAGHARLPRPSSIVRRHTDSIKE